MYTIAYYLALVLLLLVVPQVACYQPYVSHTFQFPSIPQSAGLYHIHSPIYFMEAHGFALPGFKVVETCKPHTQGDYIVTEFSYKTHFGGTMSARIFSNTLNTSHIVVMDPDRTPCLLGKLTVKKFSSRGHELKVYGNLLRPANIWERMMGGQHLVKESEVERAIKLGYSNFKNDLNLKIHVNLILEKNKYGI